MMRTGSDALFASNEVIILAGGLGERLRPSLGEVPKPMVSVLGRPFLEWMLIYLRSVGFRSFIISVGYRREIIKSHFQNGEAWDINIRYVEEDTPLGTGGALKKVLLQAKTADIFVSNGDSLCMCDIHDFFQFHALHEGAVTLCCVRVGDTSRYGSVRIGPGSRIETFVEKDRNKRQGYINSGIYWMKKNFEERIDGRLPLSLEKDIFPEYTDGSLCAYISDADFIDIGTADSLARAPEFLRRNGFLNLTPVKGREGSP